MCKIKYFLFLKNKSTFCFNDQYDKFCLFFGIIKIMSINKFKKNPTTEIKEKIKNSKFVVLTNENDFLVKTLKKAG